ncbi:hypothetical protein ACQ4PT_007746 [Festuca glaucescens]
MSAEATGAANAARLEKEVILPERTMGPCHELTGEKGDRIKDIPRPIHLTCVILHVQFTELNNEVQALHTDKEILTTNLNKAEEKIIALNNGMQALYRNQEVMKSNLNKAEEEVVDILTLSAAKEQQQKQDQQDYSEGEEPIELDPKDKGQFNFLNAVSDVACTSTNTFNVIFVLLAYIASGRHATSELQKLVLVVCGICFMPFSIVTAEMVHSLERKAKDIDVATGFVFAEILYAFGVICLVAMFVAKVPWFVVVPLFFAIWLFMTNWLVTQYRRPRWLYRGLRSVKKRFKDKGHM